MRYDLCRLNDQLEYFYQRETLKVDTGDSSVDELLRGCKQLH